jgi:5-amino-6-(5-phosphoribosylamino)uracil reductase
LHYLRLAKVVLVEGGPSIMGQFVAAGLVDELSLTLSPMMAAGVSVRLAHGPEAEPPLEMRLAQILHGDRSLFLRYLRA